MGVGVGSGEVMSDSLVCAAAVADSVGVGHPSGDGDAVGSGVLVGSGVGQPVGVGSDEAGAVGVGSLDAVGVGVLPAVEPLENPDPPELLVDVPVEPASLLRGLLDRALFRSALFEWCLCLPGPESGMTATWLP